jgi:hypothetical protein
VAAVVFILAVVRGGIEAETGLNVPAWASTLLSAGVGGATGAAVRRRRERRRADACTALRNLVVTSTDAGTGRCSPDAIADLTYLAAHIHLLPYRLADVHTALLDTFSLSEDRILTPYPIIIGDVAVDDIMLLMRYRDIAQRHPTALRALINARTGGGIYNTDDDPRAGVVAVANAVHRDVAAALRELPADVCAVADLIAGDTPLPDGWHVRRQQLLEFAEQNPWQNLIDTATALTP